MTTSTTFQVPPTPTGVYTIAIGGSGGSGGILNGSSITTPPVPYVDHTITGETIAVEHVTQIYHDIPFSKEDEAHIKATLMEKLVHELFKSKHIEFTRMKKVDSDEMIYRARIHAVPDTQVRLIRELKNAK
jgi:hypothetical protein